jgi:predicted DNA-binding protein
MGRDGADAKRVTTTLTSQRKKELENLAEREGVKEAWIVRRALEKYLDEIGAGSIISAEGVIKHARG